jgi:hypothetical protein
MCNNLKTDVTSLSLTGGKRMCNFFIQIYNEKALENTTEKAISRCNKTFDVVSECLTNSFNDSKLEVKNKSV